MVIFGNIKEKKARKIMKKIYKGWELMKAIVDGEIKEGSKIKINEDIYIFCEGNFIGDNTGYYLTDIYNDIDFATAKFELIEDEINIDSIEEYKQEHTERCIDIDIRNKMNEILQAVKQLNERVKRLEEK